MTMGPPDPGDDDLAPLRGIVVALSVTLPFYGFIIWLFW